MYDKLGQLKWAKLASGSNYEYIKSIKETKDGGYILEGYSNSSIVEIDNNKKIIKNRTLNLFLIYIEILLMMT